MELHSSLAERATALQLRIRDCNGLLEHASGYANRRWRPRNGHYSDLKGFFSDLEDTYVDKPHLVNTSTALAVMCRHPDIFPPSKISAYDSLQSRPVCNFYEATYKRDDTADQGFWPSKETMGWSPYVTSLALSAIAARFAPPTTEPLSAIYADMPKFKNIVQFETEKLATYLTQWANHALSPSQADYDHIFFAYTAWTALLALARATKSQTKDFINSALENLLVNRFKLEFYSQMAFKLADLPRYLDISTLVLSLYSLTVLTNDTDTLPDDVVDAGLDAVFSLQQPTGFWATSTPLLGAATGRVGCSSIELAICLIRIPRLTLHFERYAPSLDRLFGQLLKEFDILKPERGWSVDIRRNGSARQTWYGFLVYEFVYLFGQKMATEAAALILRGFRYSRETPKLTWDNIADYNGLKTQLVNDIIAPRLQPDKANSAKCSIIFFGPPGTGKTTIASALAHKLNWGMIEIGPGDFLSNGLEGIFAQGDSIFQRLLMLDRVVVLFDEIDELVQARHGDADKISRFLTTYMLPWIQRLRDRASLVFIFATNRIEVFDPAIRRLGRFDLVIPLGPPQGVERARILRQLDPSLSEDIVAALSGTVAPQATIGEIKDALDKCRRLGELNVESIIARLKIGMGTSDEEWNMFINTSKLHTLSTAV